MISRTIAVGAETVQIRTLTWPEFYRIRPDLRPANDNVRTAQPLSFSEDLSHSQLAATA